MEQANKNAVTVCFSDTTRAAHKYKRGSFYEGLKKVVRQAGK